MADDGVLNSSLCCHTTHTHAGHTGAEHYNSYHRLLIAVIIAALFDLSMLILGTLHQFGAPKCQTHLSITGMFSFLKILLLIEITK
jgi:hypothetical protein